MRRPSVINSSDPDVGFGLRYFFALHKKYKRGEKSQRQIKTELITELEGVWFDDDRLALAYDLIDTAGLGELLPPDYRPDFTRYTIDNEREIRARLARKKAWSEGFWIILATFFAAGIALNLAGVENASDTIKNLILCGIFTFLYAMYKTAPSHETRMENIPASEVAKYRPDLSQYYIPAFRKRARPGQSMIRRKRNRVQHIRNPGRTLHQNEATKSTPKQGTFHTGKAKKIGLDKKRDLEKKHRKMRENYWEDAVQPPQVNRTTGKLEPYDGDYKFGIKNGYDDDFNQPYQEGTLYPYEEVDPPTAGAEEYELQLPPEMDD